MTEINSDLPFLAEYAKSGRASCKACKTVIGKGDLRMAAMVQSPMFDGKVPHWYHPKCFFGRNRPKAVGDIAHFDAIRWEDQEKLRVMLEATLKGMAPTGKGKSCMTESGTLMKDFRLEYAKSGASKCGVCEEKIKKGEVRAGKKEYESQRAKMYGPYDRWHHLDCFVKNRDELAFFEGGDKMAGFMTLSADDQTLVKSKINPVKRKLEDGSSGPLDGPPDAKRAKAAAGDQGDAAAEKEVIKKQNKKIYYYRDQLEKSLRKSELQDLLECNGQEVPSGVDRMLDRLGDVMTFGALEPCPECKDGQLAFVSGVGYQCRGNISEWTKCQYKTTDPKRKPFTVPKEFRERFSFMGLYKYKPGKRVIPINPASAVKTEKNPVKVEKQEVAQDAGTESSKIIALPLKGSDFVLEGSLKIEKVTAKVVGMGGKIKKTVSKSTAALICDKDYVLNCKKAEKTPTNLKAVEKYGTRVVTVEELDGYISEMAEKASAVKKSSGSSSSSMFVKKDMPKSVKMTLKGGGLVDPDSKLEAKAHVLKVKDSLYSAVLGAVSLEEGKNSFYKLQVLEHDKKPKWYVFRAWGRIGTTIGGNKTEEFPEKGLALSQFECLYEEKTGNRWSQRHSFKKVPNKFYPMDLDYGPQASNGNGNVDDLIKGKLQVASSKSKLAKPVQELVATIFDIESMKKAMIEFEIDLTKMPLGKLSRKQIENAYKILSEAQGMLEEGTGTDTKFLDASNRFFTLIPHDFGMNSPPILNNADFIKAKIGMLDNLMEIEVAYNLIATNSEEDKGKDPIDAHYQKLKTDIEVLDKSSEEYRIIESYVHNTHAATHTLYRLEIDQVFKVSRKGEGKRFKPFLKLENRMLLWHGSRTTNYAGILSQGLRIAPPEAPVTGYMFGKGIYFADMVSKSANYCCTTRSNNTGLLLLCDVALGNIYERTQADYIQKLPSGKHSTKGVGKTEPDPGEFAELGGSKVPCGKPVARDGLESSLLYNEFIVYDVGQVQVKYLLKLKFNYA